MRLITFIAEHPIIVRILKHIGEFTPPGGDCEPI